jgi:hypothetical protein
LKKLFLLANLLCVFNLNLTAQISSNLQITYKLIEKSISQIDSLISNPKIISFNYSSPLTYEFLKPHVVDGFVKKGFQLKDGLSPGTKIEYSIQSINVEYLDPFKDGFFGDIFVLRNLNLNASVVISDSSGLRTFHFISLEKDTVNVDVIASLENSSIPFTQAPVPEIPLFSNLLEPIIVVGTLIVTVILFFTIRSK